MVKIEAIVQPFRLDAIKLALDELGIPEITIYHVFNHGGQMSLKAVYRGSQYCVEVPRVKLEMVVSSLRVDEVIEALSNAARTGVDGDDCTVLLYEIADAIRMRNGKRVAFTLSWP